MVTGAGAGIGAAITRVVAEAGAAVAVVDVNGDAASVVADSIRDFGGTAVSVVADIRDEAGMHDAVHTVEGTLGDLWGLVNNAGITRRGTVADGSLADWDDVLTTNVRGTLLASRAAFASLARVGGSVVTVTSVAADHPAPGRTGYSSSKAALTALTRQMALEWGPHGIRVNGIAPGVISGTQLSSHESVDLRDRRSSTLPLRRTGTGEDVAAVVLFLLSDLARYVTGEIVAVDGGWGVSLLDRLPGILPARDAAGDAER